MELIGGEATENMSLSNAMHLYVCAILLLNEDLDFPSLPGSSLHPLFNSIPFTKVTHSTLLLFVYSLPLFKTACRMVSHPIVFARD